MKGMKLSKTSWLILSAGLFVVILAGLGVTRSQQLQEQTKLDEELAISETRLNKLQVTEMNQRLAELQEQLEESEARLTEAKDRMRQTVESIDVTDKFFVIAEYSGVEIMNITTSEIQSGNVESISAATINISAYVTGELDDLIDFVINLNSGYTTGVVTAADITIPEEDDESQPSASLQMIIYSYEGA